MLVYACSGTAGVRTVPLSVPAQEFPVCQSGRGEWVDSTALFQDAYAVQDLIYLLLGMGCMFALFLGWSAGNQR